MRMLYSELVWYHQPTWRCIKRNACLWLNKQNCETMPRDLLRLIDFSLIFGILIACHSLTMTKLPYSFSKYVWVLSIFTFLRRLFSIIYLTRSTTTSHNRSLVKSHLYLLELNVFSFIVLFTMVEIYIVWQ